MWEFFYSRSIRSDLVMLARLPVGRLLEIAYSLQGKALPAGSIHEIAADIQRELCVVWLLQQVIASDAPRKSLIAEVQHENFTSLSLHRLIGPARHVDAFLRARFLQDPEADLEPEYRAAHELQFHNALPPDVPTIGDILISPRIADGPGGFLPLPRKEIKAVLITQAALRSMLPLQERRESLKMRAVSGAPSDLVKAQTIANRLLESKDEADEYAYAQIDALCSLAETQLAAVELFALAGQVRSIRRAFRKAISAAALEAVR